jgi:UPF0176 protein
MLDTIQTPNTKILLFYLYTPISNPESFMRRQRRLCEKLTLKGRIIIATEGLNGTLEGSPEHCKEYMGKLVVEPGFENIKFKISDGTGQAFPKLQIRVRDEIVATKLEDFNNIGPLARKTGKYLSAEELHDWIHSDKEFYIVDMRNDYEYVVGHFDKSVLFEGFGNFRELPNMLPQIEHLKNKTIVTVCTGGVRCEKASGVLLSNGFNDVYQLKDGIVTYMEKYPNQDFLGKLYVFDGRLTMGFNTEDSSHKSVGKCLECGKNSENILDYYRADGDGFAVPPRIHNIACQECIDSNRVIMDTDKSKLIKLPQYRHLQIN